VAGPDRVRGFVAQSMRGQKPNRAQTEPYVFPSATAAYTFIVPKAGYWKFVGWGPGGQGSGGATAGASGAYVEITKFLPLNSRVTIAVAQASDTVFTFPDGSVATAGKASAATAGAASGGDVNLAGTAGVLTGGNVGNPGLGTGGGAGGAAGSGSGGAGAPANLPYRGGVGGSTTGPGVGAGSAESTVTLPTGLALAMFVRV
jgi:hypothetical protein